MQISSIGPSFGGCAKSLCPGSLVIKEHKDLEINCHLNDSSDVIPLRFEMRVCCDTEWCDSTCSLNNSCLAGTKLSGQNILKFACGIICSHLQIECWAINSYTGKSFRNIIQARARSEMTTIGTIFVWVYV